MSSPAPVPRRVRLALAVLALAMAAVVASGAMTSARAQPDPAAPDTPVVDVLPVSGFLDPPVASAIVDLIADAQRRQAELVVIQVDGPGAISADADSLLAAVREATVPVVVFAAPHQGVMGRAGGLYGLLWATAPVRAMSETTTIGPVDPLDLASGEHPGAKARARLDEIGASAALDQARTAEQLEASGAVDVIAANVAGMLPSLDGRQVELGDGTVRTLELEASNVSVRLHSLGILTRLLHAAAAPAFIYLLLVVGLGALLFEVFQPGFGVAGVAGLLMLPFAIFGLFVLPVAWWALALLLVGLALYTVDAAIAGLGTVTAAATVAFGVGSWWLFGTGVLRVPAAMVVLMTITVLVFFVIVLTMILRAQAGPEGVDLADLVERHGIVRSVLNPEGHVYIDDALWRARAPEGPKLRVGTPVTVTGVDGAVLLVAPFDPDRQATPA